VSCPAWCRRGKLCARCQRAERSAPDIIENRRDFDDYWNRFNDYIGRHQSLSSRATMAPGSVERIAHLTDLHVPHLDETAFARVLAETAGFDTAVLGGDFWNAGAASRFLEVPELRSRRESHPRVELLKATAILSAVASHYPRVKVNRGNHVDRVRKYFAKQVPPELHFLIMTDPLSFIVDGLQREQGTSNIELARPVVDDLPTSDWLTIVGDCAFTHAESSSSVKMRPAENTAKFLNRWRHRLPTIRVVCQEHNHKGGKVPDSDLGMLLVQTPALSIDQPYQFAPDIRSTPNQIGYTRVVQVDGVTDWNRTDFQVF
jgi:hypothetical protein